MKFTSLLFLLAVASGCREEEIYTMYTRDDCGLTEIPTDIPTRTESVILSNNKLTRLEFEQFADLTQCVTLVLDNNLISNIENKAFDELDHLETLSLSGNELKSIDDEMIFFGIKELVELDLSYNQITDMEPEAFKYLPNLSILYLKGNNLTVIYEDMWYGLYSLTQLWLNFNQIRVVWDNGFANLPLLERLVLNGNLLTTLEANAFSPIDTPGLGHPTYLVLSIDENPLHCDAKMCWMKDAEQEGWLSYEIIMDEPPECANLGGNWYDLDLHCTEPEPEHSGQY